MEVGAGVDLIIVRMDCHFLLDCRERQVLTDFVSASVRSVFYDCRQKENLLSRRSKRPR
jgi:hypothetical protein